MEMEKTDGNEAGAKTVSSDRKDEKSPEVLKPPIEVREQPRMQFGEDGKPLSKRGLKKLKKREQMKATLHIRRAQEREKKKQRKREAIERGEDLGPSRKRLKKNLMKNSNCKIQVVIDSSYDEYMSEKEIFSHVQQIQFAYSANRRAENPIQFTVTSIGGKSQTRLDQLGDYKGWDVNFRSEHYLDAFEKKSVVYLTSDSPHVLDKLEEDKVYIIGGLVDHNNHKGLCYELAQRAGVAHARLPISEYINMYTRKVLACNHVFEVLLRYTECNDWEQAFLRGIPNRKGAAEKFNHHHQADDTTADQSESSKEQQSPGEERKDGRETCELTESENMADTEKDSGEKNTQDSGDKDTQDAGDKSSNEESKQKDNISDSNQTESQTSQRSSNS